MSVVLLQFNSVAKWWKWATKRQSVLWFYQYWSGRFCLRYLMFCAVTIPSKMLCNILSLVLSYFWFLTKLYCCGLHLQYCDKTKLCCNFQLEKRNVSASQTLRSALFKTENTHPGFAYNLVAGIMKQGDISINMNESVLRLQGTVSDLEGKF